ncbi:MAG: NAD(P)-dependent alcohol dehydrogenase [Chthoniobacterales bacterium]|nr:NAD(P)-dependent alcohol dehydrogenase [Chthoniobacterales bacterium]
MKAIKAYAATAKGAPLELFEYTPDPLGDEEVEIAVDYCGICHSDLSVLHNQWGNAVYPLVPGHEVSGRIIAAGDRVKNVQVGDRVGLGWYAASCMACADCLRGDHNFCPSGKDTIIGRHGGFAECVRAHWAWAIPIPDGVDPAKAGPLFCGGITVFNPIVQFGVKPTDRVGVIGVGGLGHLAVQFLNKWGCEVFAFTSSEDKKAELQKLGAHHVVNSRDPAQFKALARSMDFLLVTVNVPLDWGAYIETLAPRGRLHFVGAVLEPLNIGVFPMLVGQRSVSASPLGSPATTARMLDFCARHGVEAVTESFPMSKVNDALAHLESGRARYRIVLENDLQ